MFTWPADADYLKAAEDYAQAGRPDDAALLRRIATTGLALEVARTQWNIRYDHRPPARAEELIDGLRRGGHIDFDPAGPYFGVDGAVYEPGVLAVGMEDRPVVVVTGRGSSEFLADWPDYAAMSKWVASRGTTGSGELCDPPARAECRGWHEDTVLARLVSSPRDVLLIEGKLMPDAFTTDVRYEVYQSVLAVAARGQGGGTPESIAAELTRRMANVPSYGLAGYGGASGLFAHAYLGRLAATHVTRDACLGAVTILVQGDEHDRVQAARPHPASGQQPARGKQLFAAPGSAALQGTAMSSSAVPLLRPPEPPAAGSALVQRR
jgi:hypothetical protein